MSENSNNKERISEKLSSEKANTKKKGILPVIIGIAAVIIVIVGVIILTQGGKSKDTASEQRNVVVNPDNLDDVLDDLKNQKTESGTYEVTMNTTWEFEKGDSASTNAYVENSTSNKNAVYFDIVRTDTGDKIYESPVLTVGSHLEKITLKKLMVFSMTGAMMLAPMSAMAAETVETASPAEGTQNGTGSLEGYVDKNVFAVVLPTTDENTFKFTLDPQGLISASKDSGSSKADFASADVEEGATLLFKHTDGSYGSKSNDLTAKNKGTSPVDVSVEADATNIDSSVALSSSDTFSGSDPAIYLALTSGDTTNAVDTDSKKATFEASLSGVSTDNYQVKYNSGTSKYEYAIKDSVADSEFPTVDFNLTGAANTDADWKNVTTVGTVNVKWTLTAATDVAPSVKTTASFTKGTALEIPVTLGQGDKAAKGVTVTATSANAANATSGSYAANSSVTYANGKITIATNAFAQAADSSVRYIKVAFSDKAKTVKYITVTIHNA